ncbi:hypothetical protein P3U41_06275 [Mammaliicoccus sciuri]|uniref:hypothetical protein n=1 Tax=Mammaliicoccus sciuri TaxID=1296 RepID=UPI002B25EDB4|nr:hypothetical protein [Mammaliicoccus sciuri]WQL34377.1 hypothetical protein P3U41_06275 [Mammaliicoccus sciuri]WQL61316.1 hypothetical protein P3T96_06275 [Mammaliicoccus sciuri]
MGKKNKKELLDIFEMCELQYIKVSELMQSDKQKGLNKAVDTLIKLVSLSTLVEQEESQYQVIAMTDEEIEAILDEMDDELLAEDLDEVIVTDNDLIKIKASTEHITDKSIEYYKTARKAIREQLIKDVHIIRNMSDDELNDYIESFKEDYKE